MIAVVRFPGSNCDEDAARALRRLGARVEVVWHRDADLTGADAVVLPGGFSYGDYLRSGALAAMSPIMEEVRRFAAAGRPVLGICNGFQILTESGLLPGALTQNNPPHFICRTVGVAVERADLIFTAMYRQGEILNLPIAHAEGRYHLEEEELARLEDRNGVVFRYVPINGSVEEHDDSGLGNPNGSVALIAGVVNERGNVLGMMPHPERATEELLGSSDGRPLLAALVESVSDLALSSR